MTDKLKEMIEKLKKQSETPKQDQPKEEEVKEAPKPIEDQPKEEVKEEEVKEAPKQDQPKEEDLQKKLQEIGSRIVDLQNNGIFRYELIETLNSIENALKTVVDLFKN